MTPTADELKAYGRIPSTVSNTVVQLCIDAAVESLRDQGVPPVNGSSLYRLCVLMLALHYYDNRGVLADKTATLPYGLQSVVNQLHYAPEVSHDGV